MNHTQTMQSQLARLASSFIFFVALTAVAVIVDLLSEGIRHLGVADFTYYLLSLTAHFMLALDVLLFIYVALFSAWDFLKGRMQ